MRAGAANSRLAQHTQRLLIVERPLEPPELAVDLGRVLDLGLGYVWARAPLAMLLEHEAAEVAQLKLAQPAQEADPGAHPGSLAAAGWRGAHAGELSHSASAC